MWRMDTQDTVNKNILTQLKQMPNLPNWLRKESDMRGQNLTAFPPEMQLAYERGRMEALFDLAKIIEDFRIE